MVVGEPCIQLGTISCELKAKTFGVCEQYCTARFRFLELIWANLVVKDPGLVSVFTTLKTSSTVVRIKYQCKCFSGRTFIEEKCVSISICPVALAHQLLAEVPSWTGCQTASPETNSRCNSTLSDHLPTLAAWSIPLTGGCPPIWKLLPVSQPAFTLQVGLDELL